MPVLQFLYKRNVTESLPFERAYRIELLNKLIVFTCLFMFAGMIYRAFTHEHFFLAGIAVFIVLLGAVYLLNSDAGHERAMNLYIGITNIFMFFSCWLSGLQSGVYLLYFTIITGYALVLKFYHRAQIILFIGFTLLLFFINYSDAFWHFLPRVAYVEIAYQQKLFTVVSFVTVAFFTYLIIQERKLFHSYQQKQIAEANAQKAELDQALREKNVLLAEVYHRVKNNLSVVSSMLSLQLNTVENEYTRNVLMDSKNRIASMAMIHQHFYEKNDFSKIDIRAYIDSLLKELSGVFRNVEREIKTEVLIEQTIYVDLYTAIPVGIILNEIVTNIFKHAFTGRTAGKISVKASQKGNMVFLSVKDDGVGFNASELSDVSGKSLGLILIEALAGQIEAEYAFHKNEGTLFTLQFETSNETPDKLPHEN